MLVSAEENPYTRSMYFDMMEMEELEQSQITNPLDPLDPWE